MSQCKQIKWFSFTNVLSLLIGLIVSFYNFWEYLIGFLFSCLFVFVLMSLSWKILLARYQKQKQQLYEKFVYFFLHLLSFILLEWLLFVVFKKEDFWNNRTLLFLFLMEAFFITSFELKYALVRTKKVLTDYNEFKINEVEFKLQVIQEQLNPHFLFNSLNVLKSLISIDPEKAIKYTVDLADLLRITIDSDKKETSVKEELELCNLYLSIQNSRFSNNIFFNVALNPEEKQYQIPFLTLIILIENAIKHNVISTQQKLFINLSIDGSYLILKNNLNKKHHSVARKGIGLDSINYRCKMMVNREIEIQENKDYFSVKIPYKND